MADDFMNSFKYYKSNKGQPTLENVLYVENINLLNNELIPVPKCEEDDDRTTLLGLKPIQKWRTYNFKNHSGLVLIRNPFTSLGQRFWIKKCLEEYPRTPNKKNIDTEMAVDDWWQACHQKEQVNNKLLKKLRWTTLGYHHNWDIKIYSENNKGQFPVELAELSDVVACHLGFTQFRAEAAIVNYYFMKSTLSAHTDHSEHNLDAPLLSFSFGQSAIFLIGGQTKATAPSAVLLQSGDIMVMSKEARLCYHAVPKIIPSSDTPWNDGFTPAQVHMEDWPTMRWVRNSYKLYSGLISNVDDQEWKPFSSFISESRINMNVRQVLNEDQSSLSSTLDSDDQSSLQALDISDSNHQIR